jgi:hypothetical protein
MSIVLGLTHFLHTDHTLSTGVTRVEGFSDALAVKGTILVILAQCTAVTSSDAPTDEIAEFLKAEYLPLLRWFRRLLDNQVEGPSPSQRRGFAVAIAHLLRIMLDAEMDDGLASMVLSSPHVIAIGFKLWGEKFGDDGYATGPGKGCVVSELWKSVLRHDVGRHSFLVHTHTFPRRAKSFVTTFRDRLRELAGGPSSQVNASHAISRIRDLIHLANHILEPTVFPPHFLLRLHSPELVFDTTETLYFVILRGVGDYSIDEVLSILSFIFDIIYGDRGLCVNPVKKVKAALEGCLYPVLCHVMCRLPSDENDYQMLLDIMVDISTYAVYPEVIPSLANATDRIHSGPCPFLDAASRECWKSVNRWTTERLVLSRATATDGLSTTMCHYIQVCWFLLQTRFHRSLAPFPAPRQQRKCKGDHEGEAVLKVSHCNILLLHLSESGLGFGASSRMRS